MLSEPEGNSVSDENSRQVLSLTVHRSLICADMIEHFKDEESMKCELIFTIINERGKQEAGVGVGVNREVFCLFWKEFANAMTIGERERVPFVRHDHFIKEWEAVGRILVKGFISVSYFPLFLSKAFMCYCLFDAEVPDSILLESFMKYLSPVEEELVKDYLVKDCFPENENDECKNSWKGSIAEQESVRRILVVERLKQYPQFQSISSIQGLYDACKPTNKKVLETLEAHPNTEAERDALKFLQRYIRGLDNAKLIQFLRFTTASDALIANKIEIAFTRLEGAACRPIAHTCGPLLELPCTYSNFVELREQFNNILDRNTWEMDIM
ncbi:hypothetical protein OS493_006732 [Desmophyllum pertusum]|uniref:HECT domain-containing protein n=1 Tax=Desmophyllum pertusum TaxID=174260 RepID=A0A9W9ZSL7_9CNID|nr:hypothetical protein OS493_006732 [Desmophyllum pertusum]